MSKAREYDVDQMNRLAMMEAYNYRVIDDPEPGIWYDWISDDGKFGQCCMNSDGTWKQEPVGRKTKILRYDPVIKHDQCLQLDRPGFERVKRALVQRCFSIVLCHVKA